MHLTCEMTEPAFKKQSLAMSRASTQSSVTQPAIVDLYLPQGLIHHPRNSHDRPALTNCTQCLDLSTYSAQDWLQLLLSPHRHPVLRVGLDDCLL